MITLVGLSKSISEKFYDLHYRNRSSKEYAGIEICVDTKTKELFLMARVNTGEKEQVSTLEKEVVAEIDLEKKITEDKPETKISSFSEGVQKHGDAYTRIYSAIKGGLSPQQAYHMQYKGAVSTKDILLRLQRSGFDTAGMMNEKAKKAPKTKRFKKQVISGGEELGSGVVLPKEA